MKKISLFAALTKVDEVRREVWGLATAEVIDKDGEIFDYVSSKPYFEAWSGEIAAATAGRSLGNVREMHRSSAVGKIVALHFDDVEKTIGVGARIVDDDAWLKCVEGVYTGFSIGGRYVNLWPDEGGEFLRFTAQPVEISVVDNPAVPNAFFTAIKSDGSSEVRKFAASSNAGAKAHSLEDEPFRWTEVQLPPTEVGGSHLPARGINNGEAMKPEQEQKLDKAITQSESSLGKIEAIDKKLESLEAGLKELAEAFRKFSEGFAKGFTASDKRVARTSIVSKEDDGRARVENETSALDAMKAAHAHPMLGA